ncbi:MAG TPA: hypothetical protein VFC38_07230 [Stellaceae bacterium]|nr:hypothetical protein [Stellaceae bacterium]
MTSRSNLFRRAWNRLTIERDLLKWRRVLAPLRSAKPPSATRNVLFCNLMTMPATAKVEALMAGLLRLKGYRPMILLQRPDRPIEEIFRAAVPETEFIYLESAIDGSALAVATTVADTIVARTQDLHALVKLEIDGFRIGRNVQSMVLRQFRVGRLDNDDPRHRAATRATLARSLAAKRFVERLLDEKSPDIAVFVERGYTPAGEIFDACILRGIDVVQWCGAPQSDCLIFRRYGRETRNEHPLTLSETMWQRLLKMPWTAENDRDVADRIAANYASGAWYNRQQLQEGKAILTPDALRRRLGLDPAKKTAVIFTHILYDATFFYGESLFEDYEQWLVETVRAAIANPRLNWVVKVHPVNVWRSKMDGASLVQLEAQTLQKNFGALPDHVKLMAADTDINTFSLFDVADYGLTVRGTIGMELPCFGIPVVTAGTGRYSGRGFTIDPATREQYSALLAGLQDVPRLTDEAIRRARLHYHGALNLRPVPMRSFTFDYHAAGRRGGTFKYDVLPNRRLDESLLATEDLGRLAHWLTQLKTPELLARDL